MIVFNGIWWKKDLETLGIKKLLNFVTLVEINPIYIKCHWITLPQPITLLHDPLKGGISFLGIFEDH